MWEPWTLIAIPIVVCIEFRGTERGSKIVLETHPVAKKLEQAIQMIPTPRYSIHMYKWELRQCHNFPKKKFQMDGGKLLSDLALSLFSSLSLPLLLSLSLSVSC